MKVLFLKDVARIGRKGEIKEVADGFAYNNLIPRKLAVPATEAHVNRAEMSNAHKAETAAAHAAKMREFFKEVETNPLTLTLPANDKGHLFKGVHAGEIKDALSIECGLSLEVKDILLPAPLKEVGRHEVAINSGGVKGVCVVIIQKK